MHAGRGAAYPDPVPITQFCRKRLAASGYDYPMSVPLFEHITTAALATIAVAQRDGFVPPGWSLLIGAVVAIVPVAADVVRPGALLPRPVLAAVVIVATTLLMLDPPTTPFDIAPLLLAMMVGEVAATSGLVVSLGSTAAAMAVPIGFAVAGRLDGAASWYVLAIGLGWIIGRLMQIQLRLLQQERQARVVQAEQSAVAERQRIAREVHDVIAHSLSVTLLHLTAARRELEQDRDIDEAIGALADAERLGRQAMADIRRTVGLLGAGSAGTRPEPGIGDVPDLVDDYCRAGLPVRYELRGDPSVVTAATGLGIYRISQESLANVVKHAPGLGADVLVSVDTDAVTVDVRNPVRGRATPPDRGTGSGSGLRGMRERVTLLGGDLHAGPAPDGWRVHARVPLPTDTCAFGLVRRAPRPT